MKDANSFCNEFLSVESTLIKIEKLQRDRRCRDACKLFFIEGVKNFTVRRSVLQAMERSRSIDLNIRNLPFCFLAKNVKD
jgi:hypothetical protein